MVCKILNDTILLMSQNCYNNVYDVKKFMKILTFVNNMNSLDEYPFQQILLIVQGFYKHYTKLTSSCENLLPLCLFFIV